MPPSIEFWNNLQQQAQSIWTEFASTRWHPCLHETIGTQLNILQIISGRGVNGALVYCGILSEELARRGHNVTLLCRPGSWMKENVDPRLVSVIESPLTRLPLTELKRFAGFVKDQRIDLVHSHMTRAQNFAVGLKMMTGIPVVATAHNRHFEFHWNFNDYVIANSKSTFDYHRRINRVSNDRMATVYCCSDFQRLRDVNSEEARAVRTRLGAGDDDFLIGVIGEVAARKGHRYLVEALPEIVRHIPNCRVVFVGRFGRRQPHVRRMRRFILQKDLARRIVWAGRQSNVAAWMSACQVTVVPSLEEPLGLVAIESLMAGTPVVASDTGGLQEIVKHNETGMLVPVADSAAIARAVIQLAANPEQRSMLGSAGQKHVANVFDPVRLIEQVEEIYFQLMDRRLAA